MLAGMRAIAAAVAMVSVSCAAVAQTVPPASQLVPPSDQPGRERERFERPPVPLAQPGGPAITVPGIEAPPGAAQTTLVIRQIRIIGATVYTSEQLRRALRRPHRPEGHAAAGLRSRRAHHRQIRRRRLRALARHRAGAGARSQRRRGPHPGGGRLYRDGANGRRSSARYRDFFSYYAARITAERPVNIRTIERYLLLAGDLPGLKFKNSIKPHPTKTGAAILVVEVTEKPVDFFGRIDNRGTHARGPLEYLTTVTANNWLRMHEALTADRGRRVPDPGAAVLQRDLPAGADRRGPDLLRQCQLRLRAPRPRDRAAVPALQDQKPVPRERAELPGDPRARAQSQRRRRCSSPATTTASSSICRRHRRARSTACAASGCGRRRIPPIRPAASISSFSSSARASRASAAPRTAATSPRAPTGGSISPRWS